MVHKHKLVALLLPLPTTMAMCTGDPSSDDSLTIRTSQVENIAKGDVYTVKCESCQLRKHSSIFS